MIIKKLGLKPFLDDIFGFIPISDGNSPSFSQIEKLLERNEYQQKTGFSSENENFTFGFRTAKGQNLLIDQEKLKKAEKLFEKENQSSKSNSPINFKNTKEIKMNQNLKFEKEKENKSNNSSPIGFCTGKGKKLKIDSKNLKKAEKLFIAENSPSPHEKIEKIQIPKIFSSSSKKNQLKTFKSPEIILNFNKTIGKRSPSPYKKISIKKLEILKASLCGNGFADSTSENAVKFVFMCDCMNSSQLTSNSCVCGGKLLITYEYFYEKLVEMFQNISQNWIKNHFRHIVWKLASYSKRIKPIPQNKILSIENVHKELIKRFNIEKSGKRSIIQRIITKDELVSVHMVLFIASITYINNQKFYVVELSDGWYSLYLIVFNNAKENTLNFYKTNNFLLLDLLTSGKLFVGLKIHVVNMEISAYQNLTEFFDFDFIDNKKLIVNISYNSIKRAYWNEKLGGQKSRFLIKSLNSLRPIGGSISLIDCYVIRKYPLMQKTSNKLSFYFERSGLTSEKKNMKTIPNQIFFKIRIIDSLKEFIQSYNETNYVEILFNNASQELFDEINEGDRIRILNLKANDKILYRKKFDFIIGNIIDKVIVLESTKYTKIISYKDFIKGNDTIKETKIFGNLLVKENSLEIQTILENNEIINKFKKEKYEKKKFESEIDCLFYVVNFDQKLIIGKDSNGNEIRIKVKNDNIEIGNQFVYVNKIVLIDNLELDNINSMCIFDKGVKITKKIVNLSMGEFSKIRSNINKINNFLYWKQLELLENSIKN